jgi:hypothetical protein
VTRWRILLVNATLASRSGTETALRDLALGLRATGQEPMVYAPALGAIAEELRDAGIAVVSDLQALPAAPDIIHGNHHVETVQALLHFHAARGLFVCHDRTFYLSAPPRLPRLRRFVAVDRNCLERLTDDYGIPADRTRVIYNAVDVDRFPQRDPLPAAPSRAVVFSNYAGPGTHLEAVQMACARANLPLDVIGSGTGNSCDAPESILGRYDLVFAKARCALEAMATGAAVVLCDTHGVGPMVSTWALPDLRPWNFGRRLLTEPLSTAAILDRIARYDAVDARAVSDYLRAHANLAQQVAAYQQLYDEIMAEPAPAVTTMAADLEDYLRASAGRVQELASALDAFKQPYRLEPLSAAACAQLRLDVRSAPAGVASGEGFQVWVDLENGGAQALGSFPPYPLHLAYRWLEVESDTAIVAESPRSPVRPTLLQFARGSYAVHVIAPDTPGDYRLRVTLVQEGVLWMDALPHPVRADVLVTVS